MSIVCDRLYGPSEAVWSHKEMNDLFRALFRGQLPEALCHPTTHQRSLYSFICGSAQTHKKIHHMNHPPVLERVRKIPLRKSADFCLIIKTLHTVPSLIITTNMLLCNAFHLNGTFSSQVTTVQY